MQIACISVSTCDEETARQCKRGFTRFKKEFADAVLPVVSNAYFISREGSLTSPSEFLAFCQRMNLPYRQIEPDRFEPREAGRVGDHDR